MFACPILTRILSYTQTGLTRPFFPKVIPGNYRKSIYPSAPAKGAVFNAENEQKAQAGMAIFLKPPEPHDLQSALPEMRLRL
jgi:hypothetical protein